MPKFHMFVYGPDGVTDTRQDFADFEKNWKARADRFLAVIMQAAKTADVPCETALQTSDQPYEAIIATAKEKGCDLIMMASNGRRGVQAFLLGSETQKVLTHSKILGSHRRQRPVRRIGHTPNCSARRFALRWKRG